jgi:hypothetical protein
MVTIPEPIPAQEANLEAHGLKKAKKDGTNGILFVPGGQ